MRSFLFFLVFFIGSNINAQDRIKFDYDSAGNQKKRTICLNCSARNNDQFKDVSELKDEDFLSLSDEKMISYYPNPVKEELYLKWKLTNDKKVSKIELYTFSGQLINSYKGLEAVSSKEIYFSNLAVGSYLINMTYTDGEQKSITIIKK
ncbi:T9SS type A sorting domain-containing protein [Flavobacterium sp. NRK F10]|uniref:T9SS type A sorting domain-containing protein n=1 Tax=Flavobacterium sp. NRK F10 TaxID=2954931 RepID=UPI00209007A7|nr:T9SS type A sorting domain-containing protein [Flavobacterium sp. NRK F10]MCO6175239.1 T9SS type A sorting domain-containing protein [Flavobacterium sp. NRK F10]